MQTQQVLSALRSASRELGTAAASQPGTPTAAGRFSAADGTAAAAAPPSSAHLLLQISALHKAFLALSEAFMEELSQRGVEREEQQAAVESVRRECSAKLQTAAALQADVQHLAAAEAQAAAVQASLEHRCSLLEREVGGLQQQLESGQAAALQAAAAAAAQALQQQVETAVARQLAAAQQRWAAEALPPLLLPLQEAVGATAELAAQVAADVGSLAVQVAQLAQRCGASEVAHGNHEERLRLLEESSMGCRAGGGGGGSAAAHHLGQEVEQLQMAVRSLQLGHSQLDETLQQVRQQQQQQQAQREREQQQWQGNGREQQQRQQQQSSAQDELESWAAAAAAELPGVQQALAAVAEQQAQQARTTEELVQSVLADVTSLARHTKALDKEMRSLRREAQQTQQALLHSCSTFSRALAIPSPVGPFTSFPPQP